MVYLSLSELAHERSCLKSRLVRIPDIHCTTYYSLFQAQQLSTAAALSASASLLAVSPPVAPFTQVQVGASKMVINPFSIPNT